MSLLPPWSTRTVPLCPATRLVRSLQRVAVRVVVVGLGGGGVGDVAAQDHQRGAVVLGDRVPQALLQRIEVVGGVAELEHVPAVGAEAPGGVVGEREVGGPVDRDVVVVVDADEATRTEEHTSELQHLMRISYAVF